MGIPYSKILGPPLAVGLRVERRGHVELGAHQAHELSPERRGEDRIAVGHHGLGGTP